MHEFTHAKKLSLSRITYVSPIVINMKISLIILTKGGFKERRIVTKMFLLLLRSLLRTIQGTYDIVDKVWNLETYIKVEGG